MTKNVLIVIMIALFALKCYAFAQDGNELVNTRIISEHNELIEGKNRIGVLFDIEEGWHIYWKNPGDSGLPTEFEWELPDNVSISEPYFPAPKKIPFSDMANFGYEDKVIIFFDLNIDDDIKSKQIELTTNIKWLVCKEKCLSGGAKIDNTFNIGNNNTKTGYSDLFNEFQSRLPEKKDFNANAVKINDSILLTINDSTIPDNAQFFPYENGVFKNGADQQFKKNDDSYNLTFQMDNYRIEEPEAISGVLIIERTNEKYFYEIFVPIN